MKSKISTGIWLVFFGTIVLLYNFNIIDFNFYALIKYWPLMIVSVGIGLLFQNNKYGTPIIIATNTAICIFLGIVGLTSQEKLNFTNKIVYNSSTSSDTAGTTQSIVVPISENISEPNLTLNIGASAVSIDSNTTQLLEANSKSKNLGFNLDRKGNKLELNTIVSDKGSKNNTVNLALNNKVPWDLTFNIGASKFVADFSRHKIEKLQINSGAANVNFILGQPTMEKVKIEINTAASTCKISIPKDAACAVDMTTILSNNKLAGFTKKGDLWQTDNYETANNKYFIELNGAANSLKIDRY